MPGNNYRILLVMFLSLFNSNALVADQTIRTYVDNEWTEGRYIDHGDGTVSDLRTGLMWLKCSDGLTGPNCSLGTANTHDWKSALETADTTLNANYNDWRLPNTKELASLSALDRFNPAINITLFPKTVSDYYWSSTPSFSSSSQSVVINFHHGYDTDISRTSSGYVRLVRSE